MCPNQRSRHLSEPYLTKQNATQHNTTQHNTTQHNTTQHNTTQSNYTFSQHVPLLLHSTSESSQINLFQLSLWHFRFHLLVCMLIEQLFNIALALSVGRFRQLCAVLLHWLRGWGSVLEGRGV
jgi:lipopolysaccharide export LptBFGC system permease protein LptF